MAFGQFPSLFPRGWGWLVRPGHPRYCSSRGFPARGWMRVDQVVGDDATVIRYDFPIGGDDLGVTPSWVYLVEVLECILPSFPADIYSRLGLLFAADVRLPAVLPVAATKGHSRGQVCSPTDFASITNQSVLSHCSWHRPINWSVFWEREARHKAVPRAKCQVSIP